MAKAPPDIAVLRQAVDDAPGSAHAHLRLGTALLKVSSNQAEAAFRRALELDPRCVEAWVNLGGVLMARFDFQGCVEANARALEVRPDLRHAHFNRGLGYLYLGQPDELVASFEALLALDPHSAAGHYYLAVGLLAQGKVDEARQRLARAVELGHQPPPEFLKALDKATDGERVLAAEFGSATPDPAQ